MFTTQCVVVWLSPARYAINRSDFKACFARRGSGLVQNVGGIERHGYGNLWNMAHFQMIKMLIYLSKIASFHSYGQLWHKLSEGSPPDTGKALYFTEATKKHCSG
jgi:hypothetical protein